MSVAHSLDPLGAASPGMVARASLRSRTIDHFHRGPVWHSWWELRDAAASDSGGGPVVVVEHAAQSSASLDNAGTADSGGVWENQLVAQTLMVALAVIVRNEVLNSCPQRAFS